MSKNVMTLSLDLKALGEELVNVRSFVAMTGNAHAKVMGEKFIRLCEDLAVGIENDPQLVIPTDDVATPITRSAVMEKQVGGTHYNEHMGMQVWDIIDEYGLSYYDGNALKYILRDKDDRRQDLKKAIHYLEKQLENLGDS